MILSNEYNLFPLLISILKHTYIIDKILWQNVKLKSKSENKWIWFDLIQKIT